MLPLANILARPLRTAVSVLAVGVGVALFLVLVGLTGMLDEIARRTTQVEAHLMVWPASDQVVVSGGLPAEKVEKDLEGVAGVEHAIPVLRWPFKMAGRVQNVYGIRPEDWRYFASEDQILEGRALADGPEMVIDARLAAAGGYRVGQTVERWGHAFRIVGIAKEGVAGRVFMPIDTVGEALQQTSRRASFFYVRVVDPSHVAAVREAIRERGLNVFTLEEFYDVLASSFIDMDLVIGSVVFVAGFVCFLVILLTVYTMVIERTHEIGILKGIGASRAQVFGLVLSEAGLIAGAGIVTGFLLTWGGRALILHLQPLWTVEIPPLRYLLAALLAAGGTLLGAAQPAARAARQDPVESLRYE
ncbi:MAG: ABC transporter permease [Planctomycetes bacterium]|nr:ABC transporter permease [Planctomycetota bacterium]